MADSQNVVVGYLHGQFITQEFHHCLQRLFVFDAWGPQRIVDFCPQMSGVQICNARNQMVKQFLDNPRAEWLLMLDADATFPPDLIERFLADADPTERPIVGALAHLVRIKQGEIIIDNYGSAKREIVPTMYKQERGPNGEWLGYREIEQYGRGLIEVDATGAHCLLVHHTVFEAIPEGDHPHRWFRESLIAPGILAGEDITFCLQARDAGYPIFVDTTIESGHVKPFIMTSETAKELV